jgi:hypothetical protein
MLTTSEMRFSGRIYGDSPAAQGPAAAKPLVLPSRMIYFYARTFQETD